MTDGPDPERLLAEALRAQAASTPLPPARPLSTENSSTDDNAPTATPGANGGGASAPEPSSEVGLGLFSGDGHGLLSGHDPTAEGVSYPARRVDPLTGPTGTTKLNASRPPLAWWWIVLLAVALGLACGAIAGVVSLG